MWFTTPIRSYLQGTNPTLPYTIVPTGRPKYSEQSSPYVKSQDKSYVERILNMFVEFHRT